MVYIIKISNIKSEKCTTVIWFKVFYCGNNSINNKTNDTVY